MIAAFALAALTASASAHRTVATANPQAQAAFDRGLSLLYAYNGDEAYRSFAQALTLDPHLAMAAWGQALASGTDLNTPLDAERFARAQDAAKTAESLEAYAAPPERALIESVVGRYAGTYADRDADEARYRQSLDTFVAANPNDDDAATLEAEALMEHLGTDRMWTDKGAVAVPDAARAIALVSRVLQRNPSHVLANHLCMHAYDYARDRRAAIACARRVAAWTFLPAQEHLAHMPAHTYLEAGLYAQAVDASERTWRLREQWGGEKYSAHDAYTGWSAAMMLGDLHAAEAWAIRAGEAYKGSDLWATWVRFSQWSRIANSTSASEFYAPFARGLTDVHFGVMKDAHDMLALYGNTEADYRWILEAAIDEREGRIPNAIDALGRAIDYQGRQYGGETLPLFPAGEFLGGLYFRQARYAEAADAYRQTLQRYPNDPRALYGLALTQQRLGEGVSSQQTLKDFQQIWTDATPPDLATL